MNNDATRTSTLTTKEEAFCLAVMAGEIRRMLTEQHTDPSGQRPKPFTEMTSRLMAKRKVRARLAELMQPVIQQARISREEWLERVARICLADVRKIFDSHGNPKEVTELDENEAAAIAAFECCETLPGRARSAERAVIHEDLRWLIS